MSDSSIVRVLVADDSRTARRILRLHLTRHPRIEVVGEATDGLDALAQIESLRPDVVTLDLEMPNLDGRGVLSRLKVGGPRVVVVSSQVHRGGPADVEVRNLGAAGTVEKCPQATDDCLRTMLANLTREVLAGPRRAVPAPTSGGLIAIGSSTGGVEALEEVLLRLSADGPPVVVSQHMPPGFTSSMAHRFDEICDVRVVEAEDGAMLQGGTVYVAPGDRHLRVVRSGGLRVLLGDDPKVNGHRPSVCVMFRSIAKLQLTAVRAALLTGMGRDGAAGLLALRQAGAYTVAQDQKTSVVWGMPGAAVALGGATSVLPLGAIGEALCRPPRQRRPAGVS